MSNKCDYCNADWDLINNLIEYENNIDYMCYDCIAYLDYYLIHNTETESNPPEKN